LEFLTSDGETLGNEKYEERARGFEGQDQEKYSERQDRKH